MLFTLIRLVAFFCSCLGFWEILHRNTKIDSYFFPSLTIAFQVSVLFIAGILNLLAEAVFLLFVLGIIYLIYSLVKTNPRKFLEYYCTPGYVFLLAVSAAMLLFLNGKLFVHYDNFSHWALVVKIMLAGDRFPNFADILISFQEYPLGSASYIYFFSKLVGSMESLQMFAQAYMMLSFILPLFTFCKKNSVAAMAVILTATNFFLIYNVPVNELLVDTLLALAAAGSFVYVYFCCNNDSGKFQFLVAGLYIVLLLQIKNSGIFFALLLSFYILFSRSSGKPLHIRALCASYPFISLLLWKAHCSYVFPAASGTKHAMTLESFQKVFGVKTPDDIQNIALSVARRAVADKGAWTCCFILLAAGLIIFLFLREEKKTYLKTFILCTGIYIAYEFGLLAMYLFSMPSSEALTLASFERYNKTVIIVVLYLTVCLLLRMLSAPRLRPWPSIFAGLAAVLVLTGAMKYATGSIQLFTQYSSGYNSYYSARVRMEELRWEYYLPDNSSFLIIVNSGDTDFLRHLVKYTFNPRNVYLEQTDELDDSDFLDYYDYIILNTDDNFGIQEMLLEKYSQQLDSSTIIWF